MLTDLEEIVALAEELVILIRVQGNSTRRGEVHILYYCRGVVRSGMLGSRTPRQMDGKHT